jgi:predicted transcriptional regulator
MGFARKYGLSELGFHTGDVLETSMPANLPAASEIQQQDINTGRRFTATEENILKLLSDGHSQDVVASTLGISASAVSQHLAKDWFKNELAARKSVKLEKYSKLDDSYDRLEDKLLHKLESSIPFLTKPGEIAHVLNKVNAAKRRLGDQSKIQNTPVTQIIQITLPTSIVHKFSRTRDGHVVAVDDKSLVTITSQSMDKLAIGVLEVEDAKELQNARSTQLEYARKG